ncbi:hypothetical protein GCM10023149_42550 [Mucilaginibacter gynuensis]|uniref:Glycosyltransferase RgtA/B/C/D-like domain-containing protein n=1 Tax=Mucilaginibacter gynuensis TaxID=1302236 RepID=A0ABP8H630_9SPHI
MPQTTVANKWLYLFILLAVLINFSGLFVHLMNPDATLYATIAKTMVLRNDYVNIYARGTDWLDKPHFPFWVAALFFKVFGINTWAYKLSGIVFMLMTAVYTSLLAKELYTEKVAQWAVLILLTSQHIILSDNDVRAEPYLTGLIIASVYHYYKSYTRNNYRDLLLACLFAGCAVMTKGVFALITIGGAIIGHLIITKQWKQLFHTRWLVALVLVAIFILPEIYCLYVQFDAHPEKVVFDRQGVSGIKFFLWDSQFGRFFNTGPIKGSGDPFFFVHTTLWAFLPWSLLLFVAVFRFIKKGYKNVQSQEWICICGAMITFLMFSASKFQLPHYLNIVFPFFAILTAQYICAIQGLKSIRAVRITQIIVASLLLLVIIALQYFFRPDDFTWPVILLEVILLSALVILPKKASTIWYERIGYGTILISLIVNVYLNLAFYPSLLKYQAGTEAALWINKNNPQKLPVLQSGDDSNFAMEFYLDEPMTTINADGSGNIPKGQFIFYAPDDIINGLKAKGWQMQTIQSFKRYWITRLKPKFLNKATRDGELTEMKVVVVSRVGK